METIAVYKEKQIKTYGLQIDLNLTYFQLSGEINQLGRVSSLLSEHERIKNPFYFSLIQNSRETGLEIILLLNHERENSVQPLIEILRKDYTGIEIYMETRVELISFHGPHFGDRFGIAYATFNALFNKDIPILAAGCTGASVYIVVPENNALESKQVLVNIFKTP